MRPRRAIRLMTIVVAIDGGLSMGAQDIQPSAASRQLNVVATKPVFIPHNPTYMQPFTMRKVAGRFRIIFRINSASASELPLVTVGYGGFRADLVEGWQAFDTQRGSGCIAFRQELQGIETITGSTVGLRSSLETLARQVSAQTIASPTRPTFISADFGCDGPLEIGDSISAQIRFYVRQHNGWVPADYTFVGLQVSSP